MRLVEGVVHVGADGAGTADATDEPPASVPRFDDVDALVAELDGIADAHGVTVQAFDARLVVDRAHLERAVALADRARERGEAIVRDRAVEILLYAAGSRQIDRALGMGVGEGATPAVVLVDAGGEGEGASDEEAAAAVRELLAPAETLGEFDEERVREFFDVGAAESAATDAGLPALVHERVALLVVER